MTARDDLVDLCRALGEPARDLVVLGEGNASARVDDDTILVTASGSMLATTTDADIVAVRSAAATELARTPSDVGTVGPDELRAIAIADAEGARRVPSIETLLHALLLDRTGARFVGHTHPTAVLGLACSDRVDDAFAGRIFPDEVVVCGATSLVVPYASPGLPLAAALDAALDRHLDAEGATPKVVILTGHGLLALGETAAEVLAVTTMVEKSARIRATALSVGDLERLPDAEVRALANRADERLRQRRLFHGAE